MKKIIFIFILLFITLIALQVLGSKERIGYLSDFELNENKSYNFRIRYYDKIFKNSDIYKVYPNLENLPEYIKEIKMNEEGGPFGKLISSKILLEDEKIDINYILKLKIEFILYSIIVISLLLIIILKIIKYRKILIFNLIGKVKLININRFAVILTLFLCFLITPNIVYKIFYRHFDHNNYENRNLKSKPVLELKNISEYPKNCEEYFNDYLPFRNELVQLKNLADIFLFKNVFARRVLLGKNKWLFFKGDNLNEKYIGIEKYNFTESELEIAKNNLIHFRDELKKKNIDFIFMVCPDKQSIYSEYMPDYIKRKSISNGTDIFIEYIKNNTDIKVVYPKDELLKYKDNYQLYYKYDTHWNNLGAYIGYTELMKSLNIYVDNIDNTLIKNINGNERFNFDIHFYNDMANMLSLSKFKYYNDDKTYILSNYIIKNYDTNYYNSYYDFSYNSKAHNNKNNIMIIRDSFSMAMIDYIASEFKQSEFIHIDAFKSENIIEYKPNIVVFQSVERYLIKGRMLNVIPNYKIEEINN